ncbi:protein of unknown function DUF62 [Methanohalobium evestigatum Z-7303]|uniref:Uncharacterized protein n=1 Tax=Methanohalobium evestigatum (strain ATCC BAA-1072 / DSM 3721 / NBRC 107634 / OCM 161 / Z-7303) TaxID=644295 RepID=D7EAE6_METEZ|nr:S-adenosyl-l-methionine hydroxide adenosyltransferase family protein [Methanohalobium evestigatum]ADI74945.1 protein of unknown function DUF62 [Methanohalobium evestigatum Z-7303]
MAVITLLTDFGSLYPAAMKGVILKINDSVDIVDITHSIPQADIYTGAFSLYSIVEYFPEGTVHIGVVDPGVGTERRPVAIRAGGHYFVGPDNGLMIPAARKIENNNFEVFDITNKSLTGSKISATFHGRDIFAPVGAHISNGLNIENVGHRIDDYIDLDFGKAKLQNDTVEGRIIYIDDFGNIITNIPAETIFKLAEFGTYLKIFNKTIPLLQSYGFVNEKELIALISSSGFFEVSVNKGNAANKLNVDVNDKINVQLLKN